VLHLSKEAAGDLCSRSLVPMARDEQGNIPGNRIERVLEGNTWQVKGKPSAGLGESKALASKRGIGGVGH
jgi:hypothetical protein